jgi:uncharacterized protein
MKIKTLDFAMEYKALGDTGEFSGYASVFGNVDHGGDVVERGAFKEFDLTKDGMVRMLNQHNVRDPIGKANVNEDATGLHFDGKLLLDVPSARTMYSLVKSGIVDGMSFAYDILPGGATVSKAGVRMLTALKLMEISPVTFGMNELARIQDVKAANYIKTIREFEEFLRDEGGFSAQAAKAIAAVGFKPTDDARDEPEADEVKDLSEVLAGFTLSHQGA